MTIDSITKYWERSNEPSLDLVQVDIEVEAILEHCGKPTNLYSGLLVQVKNADYARVYGFDGAPALNKPAHRIL